MIDYYKLFEYVSNSQLGALSDVLRSIKRPDNLQDIFDFGNLVDAMVTEPEKLDLESNTMNDQQRQVVFSQYLIDKAQMMKEAVEGDAIFNLLMQQSKNQYVVLRKAHRIEWKGFVFHLPMRMKADLFIPNMMVIDLKSTACTSQKSFVASLTHFNYDRQGALYMDLCRVDKMLYVGVSKTINKKTKKHDVYKYMIERNSELYLSGLDKYSGLAYKYVNYVHHFPQSNLVSI